MELKDVFKAQGALHKKYCLMMLKQLKTYFREQPSLIHVRCVPLFQLRRIVFPPISLPFLHLPFIVALFGLCLVSDHGPGRFQNQRVWRHARSVLRFAEHLRACGHAFGNQHVPVQWYATIRVVNIAMLVSLVSRVR